MRGIDSQMDIRQIKSKQATGMFNSSQTRWKNSYTLTCCESALSPKSETLRFPDASRSKFSGCRKPIKKKDA